MISKEEMLKLSRLSKITLDEQDLDYYQQQLTKLLGYFETLNNLPPLTAKNEGSSQPNLFIEREDVMIKDEHTILKALEQAPKPLGKAFGVPTVMKNT